MPTTEQTAIISVLGRYANIQCPNDTDNFICFLDHVEAQNLLVNATPNGKKVLKSTLSGSSEKGSSEKLNNSVSTGTPVASPATILISRRIIAKQEPSEKSEKERSPSPPHIVFSGPIVK